MSKPALVRDSQGEYSEQVHVGKVFVNGRGRFTGGFRKCGNVHSEEIVLKSHGLLEAEGTSSWTNPIAENAPARE